MTVLIAEDEGALSALVARAALAPRVALDTEADGLFAYRAKVCVVQLAWQEEGQIVVAVVDPRATPLTPLGPLLGPDGPEKLLHDLTFDARILGEAGIPLGNVRDTEVLARMLGIAALGLASLLASELGLSMKKGLQRHDWSLRPLTPPQLAYLAADVAHLDDLERALTAKIDALDLEPEVREETAHKLRNALAPETPRLAWARVTGADGLDATGRAVLRRLVAAREECARARDVPPFHVLGPDRLLAMARARPRDAAALAAHHRPSPRDGDLIAALLRAVDLGIADGDVPAEELAELRPPAPARSVLQRRRRLEQALSAWRRREAQARGWCEQAVLPGHCARGVTSALLTSEEPSARRDAVAQVPGLGPRRIAWFTEAWLALAEETGAEPPASA